MKRTPYEELGVPRDASQEEIKTAFRKRARETHPDHNPTKDETAYHAVQAAYDIIGNPSSRAYYDATGDAREQHHDIPKASEILIGIFGQALDFDEPGFRMHGNPVMRAAKLLEGARADMAANRKKASADRAHLRRLLKRLKRKEEVPALLESLIEARLVPLEMGIARLDAFLGRMKEASDMLSGYHLRPDNGEPDGAEDAPFALPARQRR